MVGGAQMADPTTCSKEVASSVATSPSRTPRIVNDPAFVIFFSRQQSAGKRSNSAPILVRLHHETCSHNIVASHSSLQREAGVFGLPSLEKKSDMRQMFARYSAAGSTCNRITRKVPAANWGKILLILLGLLALSHSGTALFAQCTIQPQTVHRASADDLNIGVQGTCSSDCQQITVHWINPLLPDKTVPVNPNTDDPNSPRTWSVPYGGTDGLSLTMLLNNFACGSGNFSVEISCDGVPGCAVTAPAGGLKVGCKVGDAVCSIPDIDLHCGANGRLTAETSVSSTGSENVSVTLAVTKDGQNVASRSFTDNDGFISISQDFDFAPGTYTLTTSITSPASCAQSRNSTFTITANQCAGDTVTPTPTATASASSSPTPNAPATPTAPPNNSTCPECSFCGGDWTCCVAWVFIFIGLFFLIATIMYLICDPTGGGGWGWLVLLIAALVFAAALAWIIVHCQFDICRFLEILTAAFTIDLAMVCGIEGLFPCFSALVCGVTVIAGTAIRNWFLILLIGFLILLGIHVICPFVK